MQSITERGAARWVFIRVFNSKTAANARRLSHVIWIACPLRIRTVLTDNGKEFTDRLFGLRKRSPSGRHEFDQLCADLGIEHRLAPPQHPQTNGIPLGDCMQSSAGQRVERFNGRIEEVLQSHHFHSGGLCCTNHPENEVPPSPVGLIPRAA